MGWSGEMVLGESPFHSFLPWKAWKREGATTGASSRGVSLSKS